MELTLEFGPTFLYYFKMIETSTFLDTQEKGEFSSRVEFRVLSPLQELLSLDSYNVVAAERPRPFDSICGVGLILCVEIYTKHILLIICSS